MSLLDYLILKRSFPSVCGNLFQVSRTGATPRVCMDSMPRRPAVARLRPLVQPPPFFDNLTRSTLPTSSVSRIYHPPPEPISYCSRISQSSSSLDSLRSIHTSSLQSSPTTSPWQWWFQQPPQPPQQSPNEDIDKKCLLLSFTFHLDLPLTPFSIDLAPSNPVIFCHGLLGFDSVTIGPAIAPFEVTHWRGIKEVLEQNGTQVLITRVPATSSPVDRAKVLEQKISSVYPGRSVHLIGQFPFSSI